MDLEKVFQHLFRSLYKHLKLLIKTFELNRACQNSSLIVILLLLPTSTPTTYCTSSMLENCRGAVQVGKNCKLEGREGGV